MRRKTQRRIEILEIIETFSLGASLWNVDRGKGVQVFFSVVWELQSFIFISKETRRRRKLGVVIMKAGPDGRQKIIPA